MLDMNEKVISQLLQFIDMLSRDHPTQSILIQGIIQQQRENKDFPPFQIVPVNRKMGKQRDNGNRNKGEKKALG
jgi:hypothetical protein